MSFLRNSQLALDCQAVNSGIFQPLKIDGIEVPDGPQFRLQLFSEQANDRYRAALNGTRNKNSPYFGYSDNPTIWHQYMKYCLSEFGIKDWKDIAKIDTMSEKEISDRTIDFVREEIDPLIEKSKQPKTNNDLKLPSIFVRESFCGKDGILERDGKSIYFYQLIPILSEEYPELAEFEPTLIEKLSKFFETQVACTQKNINAFLDQPRNSLAFHFCVNSVFSDKLFRLTA